jgi:hypothetical protein
LVIGLIVAHVVDDLLVRNTCALRPIAVHTSGCEVPLIVSSAVMARDNVIDFELYARGFCSAVSARVIIAAKDFKSDTAG